MSLPSPARPLGVPPGRGQRTVAEPRHREQRPFVGRPVQRVAAAFGEGDARSGHQILDRPGDQDLRGPRERRHPVGDLHRDAGDVLPDQVHLAGVNPGPDLDPGRGRSLADRGRAPDRLPGRVEGGQDAVRRGPDQPPPVPPDQAARPAPGHGRPWPSALARRMVASTRSGSPGCAVAARKPAISAHSASLSPLAAKRSE